jgi:inorganic pyrophosphatase
MNHFLPEITSSIHPKLSSSQPRSCFVVCNTVFANRFTTWLVKECRLLVWVLLSACVSLSCSRVSYTLPAFTKDGVMNAIIEIPAGTCLKTEYDPDQRKFTQERLPDGKLRSIHFLPYPGNYGFIPSTEMSRDKGGDGDALDVLVLAEAFQRGKVIRAMPIAMLKLVDNGELDYKIIAVPENPELRIIHCTTLACMQENYPAALTIIELWFMHYKENNRQTVDGWADERSAVQEINKWIK